MVIVDIVSVDIARNHIGHTRWDWVAVSGTAELVGPDDNSFELDPDRIRILLRDIFTAAGGTHDDWDGYDRAMRDEARTAVLVTPGRIRSNG